MRPERGSVSRSNLANSESLGFYNDPIRSHLAAGRRPALRHDCLRDHFSQNEKIENKTGLLCVPLRSPRLCVESARVSLKPISCGFFSLTDTILHHG